jgi:filamentous hemagglutinin family protein
LVSTALQAAAMVVLASPALAQPAPAARPTGGTVVGGTASISQSATITQIDQTSERAAINWKGFDVGSQHSVTFNQPSASAVALNRVTGPDPSQIAGRIDANGQVVLINQSGVNFYKGAQVNTAGLIVSTANATDEKFMQGGPLRLDQPGKPNAKIDNQGNITIRQAGLAALVAPQVANSGTISAKLGQVVLAGAQTATIDLYGDGLLSLDVGSQVKQVPVDAAGKQATALVTNRGVIVADGGTVRLTAAAADGVVQNLVQAGGKIRAATVGDHAGTIALNGVGGSIVVEGQLGAPGAAPGTKGGDIEIVSTGNVGVASTARISASGKAGGGTVAIGTTLDRAKGGPGVMPAMTAKNVAVQQGATIAANAGSQGNGGRIAALSTGTTTMAGTINAKGGETAGDGGSAEVSGAHLRLTAGVDLSARSGATGTLLLNPEDLTIVHGTSASGSLDRRLNTTKHIDYDDTSGGTDTVTDFEIN